jgi:26S proteasome regulatory subunit N2
MLAVVGVLVFTQYWYWFPLAHCLALAFTPTCLIALNAQLKVSMPLDELLYLKVGVQGVQETED